MFKHFATALIQRHAVVRHIAQRQRTVAAQVNVPDLNIRLKIAEVILRRQLRTNFPIAFLIMNGGNLQVIIMVVIEYRE